MGLETLMSKIRPIATVHPEARTLASKWFARAERDATRKYPDSASLRMARLCGRYEGALMSVLHNVPGAAEFLAQVEGIEFE